MAERLLVDLKLPIEPVDLPHDVREFLREADRRVEQFQHDHSVFGFVPSDFVRVYEGLRTLAATDLTTGSAFCEWGSGMGVVTCLASMLHFDACGIEIEAELVDAAQQLADDFGLPVEFHHNSFIPPASEAWVDKAGASAWLTTHGQGIQHELPCEPDDFDVIFAYPWPDEENTLERLFCRHAGRGAIFVNYHGKDDLRFLRQVRSAARHRSRCRA